MSKQAMGIAKRKHIYYILWHYGKLHGRPYKYTHVMCVCWNEDMTIYFSSSEATAGMYKVEWEMCKDMLSYVYYVIGYFSLSAVYYYISNGTIMIFSHTLIYLLFICNMQYTKDRERGSMDISYKR